MQNSVFQAILEEICGRVGTQPPDSSEAGVTLGFGNAEINLEVADEVLHIYAHVAFVSDVANLPGDPFQRLLEAHLFGYGTMGASFGINKEAGSVLLFRNFDLKTITPQEVADFLERFLPMRDTWETQLTQGWVEAPSSPESKPEPSKSATIMFQV